MYNNIINDKLNKLSVAVINDHDYYLIKFKKKKN